MNSFFIFSEGSIRPQVNAGCFKCISALNLSPANKNLLTISFIFIVAFSGTAFKTRYHPIMESYLMVF